MNGGRQAGPTSEGSQTLHRVSLEQLHVTAIQTSALEGHQQNMFLR